MLGAILIILIILWFLGFIQIPNFPLSNFPLFAIFGRTIGLYDILIFAVILWLIGLLPGIFRTIASILLVLWLLSFFGIIAITGFSSVIVLVVIFGLVYYLLTGAH